MKGGRLGLRSMGLCREGLARNALLGLLKIDDPHGAVPLTVTTPFGPNAFDACGKGLRQKILEVPSAGQSLYERTASLRSLNLTTVSEATRAISSCFARRGGSDDIRYAGRLLVRIREDHDVFHGLDVKERQALMEQLQQWHLICGKSELEKIYCENSRSLFLRRANDRSALSN